MAKTESGSAGKPGSLTAGEEKPADTNRGHVVRDGDTEALTLPRADVSNVVVTDRKSGVVVAASTYDVDGARVVKKSGAWARGTGRWLLEYDRD